MSLKNISLKPDLLSNAGLRVLDLDNLQWIDIDKFKIPFSINENLEKVVHFDQWQLWIKHYMFAEDYFVIDDRKILVAK